MERRERGELLMQKSARLFNTLLAPVKLSPPDQFIYFNQSIQLVASDMTKMGNFSESGLF